MQLLSCDPKEVRRNAASARALRPPWHTCSRKTLRGKRFLGFLGVKGESAVGRAGQTLELEEKLGVGTIRDRAQTLPPHFPGLSDTQGWCRLQQPASSGKGRTGQKEGLRKMEKESKHGCTHV